MMHLIHSNYLKNILCPFLFYLHHFSINWGSEFYNFEEFSQWSQWNSSANRDLSGFFNGLLAWSVTERNAVESKMRVWYMVFGLAVYCQPWFHLFMVL